MSGWTPHGVLAPEAGVEGAGALPPFPTHLAASAERHDLGPEHLLLAWEVARFTWPRGPEWFHPTLLLALALLATQDQGSTRLPLAPALLAPILRDLGAGAGELAAVQALLVKLQAPGELAGQAAFGAPGDYRPLVLDGDWLYSQRLLQLEDRLAGALASRLAPPAPGALGAPDPEQIAAALDDVVESPPRSPNGSPLRLSDEQREAVLAALTGQLTAVTGGPGSGKTSIVVTLLRVIARLPGPSLTRVALAAPTGRAADRMQRSVREALEGIGDLAEADLALLAAIPAATTLHRLLAYSPGGERFRRHEGNPLAEELVVVDESSMLDLPLADRLLRALTRDARLILLGDAAQLPSVQAGAVFRDLVAAASAGAAGRVVRLRHSHRMVASDPAGRAILALATAVLEGRPVVPSHHDASAAGGTAPAPIPLAFRQRAAELTFRGPELLLAADAAERQAFLERWLQERVTDLAGWRELVLRTYELTEGRWAAGAASAIEALLAHYDRSRILCATRGFSSGTGAKAVNEWLRARCLVALEPGARGEGSEGAGAPEVPRDAPWHRSDSVGRAGGFLAGEPVLMTANDYRRGLFNGDQGVMLLVADGQGPPDLRAVFHRAGTLETFPLPALEGHLTPAWATTVHKAQGSELDHAALLLPAQAVRGLTRELVYTALTRARRSVVVVGSPERLQEALERSADRHSGLAARIAEVAAAGPAD